MQFGLLYKVLLSLERVECLSRRLQLALGCFLLAQLADGLFAFVLLLES